MKVPFLDLKANYNSIREEISQEINEVLENTAYILGPKVSNFEKKFAEAHNVNHCIGVSSGTDGNHLLLWALGIGSGDEVILPANTFIATAWGITLCGAKPIFVDCEEDSYNISPREVEKAITDKTKAIIAVHLYGQPADMDPLKAIADKHNLILVEDAAQAHLAEYKGKKAGTLSVGASFSFYPGKNLGAYGEAGSVVTNDEDLALKLRMMREHGQSEKYHHKLYGHNYRMESIQGAVLSVKMKYLDAWTNKRREVAMKYNDLLSETPMITLPKEMEYAKHVYHLYVLQCDFREELADYLGQNGISTGLHYPLPLHLQECFEGLGYKRGDFPVTEKLAQNCLSLPMYPEMNDEQIVYITDKIKEFIKTKD